MKLLLKIHNKERNLATSAATTVNLFQRKRKYYHRRISKTSSCPEPAPTASATPPAQHASHPLSSTSSSSSSSSSSATVASSAQSASITSFRGCSKFEAEVTNYEYGASSSLIYDGSGGSSYLDTPACSTTERWPLLLQRNSPLRSSSRSYPGSIRSGRNNQNRGLPSSGPSTLRQERYFIYGALIFFAIVGFSSAIYFIVNQARNPSELKPPQDIIFGANYDPRTIPTLGNSHMIIDRSNWGSQEHVKAPLHLERPVSYVIITHVGLASKPCTDVYQCSNKMRVLQDAAIGERHLPDLPSNFYIGADGNVYVGRGWSIANSYHNRTVSVCFLGDYNRYEPGNEQISALQHLLTYGVVQDVLDKNYKIVGRRQTKQTTSPGDKLYPKIMQLARWNPCSTEGYTHCGAELGYPSVWDEEAIHNEHGSNNQNNLEFPNGARSSPCERCILYNIILMLIIFGLSILFYVIYTSTPSDSERLPSNILFGNNYFSNSIPNLGNGHMLLGRKNWGAQQGVQGPYELESPIPYVLITHIGVHSKNCTNVHTCSIMMRTLQDAAIAEKYLSDIQSNFYLGGDGNVYVGRDWDRANAYANKSVAICFMGDYGRYEPNELQFSALDHLLTYGEMHDLLAKDYRIVAHRQTKRTRSPGIKLYEKVIQLPRWSPCGTPGHEPCGTEVGLPIVWDQENIKPSSDTSSSSNATSSDAFPTVAPNKD
ncbi:uncharacterized protein LOC125958307 [Anopheles darlingi]|uniref:uncharacterized protein LOC125958307 n=1 Tax=Anopheles darlingi TaxID=43151 RepID=UPI002100535C|nr:uncharacterized protein LOC125958307 [Anopheles darlingi]